MRAGSIMVQKITPKPMGFRALSLESSALWVRLFSDFHELVTEKLHVTGLGMHFYEVSRVVGGLGISWLIVVAKPLPHDV